MFRKVRTKYTCIAENSNELTFNAGAIITNGILFRRMNAFINNFRMCIKLSDA